MTEPSTDAGSDGSDAALGDARLSVASVARRLGVAPATLRTWARRYGLGPSRHEAGEHRRYSSADLARLQLMRRLTLQGVPPGEAARVARETADYPADYAAQDAHRDAAGGTADLTAVPAPAAPATAVPAPAASAPTASAPADPAAHPPTGAPPLLPGHAGRRHDDWPATTRSVASAPHSGDGPIRLPPGEGLRGGPIPTQRDADAVVRGLGRAANALDSRAVAEIVRAQLAEHGVVRTWDVVLRPVLSAAGARWASSGEGIEVEHLLAECTISALRDVADRTGVTDPGRPVLLVCAPDEMHALPLYAVAAGLAEKGTGARVLGSALPVQALQAAVRRTGPAALFVWSQRPGTADPGVLTSLPVTRPPTAVIVGGPGWLPERLPDRVSVAVDLQHAVDLVGKALGA